MIKKSLRIQSSEADRFPYRSVRQRILSALKVWLYWAIYMVDKASASNQRSGFRNTQRFRQDNKRNEILSKIGQEAVLDNIAGEKKEQNFPALTVHDYCRIGLRVL